MLVLSFENWYWITFYDFYTTYIMNWRAIKNTLQVTFVSVFEFNIKMVIIKIILQSFSVNHIKSFLEYPIFHTFLFFTLLLHVLFTGNGDGLMCKMLWWLPSDVVDCNTPFSFAPYNKLVFLNLELLICNNFCESGHMYKKKRRTHIIK